MKRFWKLALLLLAVPALLAACQPNTIWHYTSNGNFDGPGGSYTPSRDNFNLADVSSPSSLSVLPSGVDALVYLGTCAGSSDPTFQNEILSTWANKSNVFGFYLMDEPDPTGMYGPLCTAANLKSESDYIHYVASAQNWTIQPKTFIIMMNLGPSAAPVYYSGFNGYTPGNTDLDTVGLDPYPCRSEFNGGAGGCDDTYITKAVTAAENLGWTQAQIVPVYQAFGGGTWTDDNGGQWILPTPSQETDILNTWGGVIPNPVFDYAYSWGVQRSDQSLEGSNLEPVFTAHN